MDSLTQITLGASVAEAIAGKKIGNRALFWGAVAGTIPDLDILANGILNDIDALAFHRGISHSLFFAILSSFLLAYVIEKIYDSKHHKEVSIFCYGTLVFVVITGILVSNLSIITAFLALIILIVSAYLLYVKYNKKEQIPLKMKFKSWYLLFFGSIVTHPILDCFTVYGTQLLLPFSDYRVAFNTISVADPLYTVPFLFCIIIVSFYNRNNPKRKIVNWIGISISSLYLLFTGINKLLVNKVVERTIEKEHIQAIRYMSGPTILNNILWHTAIQTPDTMYFGQFSWFDQKKQFKLHKKSINNFLLSNHSDDHVVNTLKWFSNNYYTIIPLENDEIQFNDMRYGTFTGDINDPNNYIFKFRLKFTSFGHYKLIEKEGGPPDDVNINSLITRLWNRIKGI